MIPGLVARAGLRWAAARTPRPATVGELVGGDYPGPAGEGHRWEGLTNTTQPSLRIDPPPSRVYAIFGFLEVNDRTQPEPTEKQDEAARIKTGGQGSFRKEPWNSEPPSP
jgi:hypothetical protein